MPNGISRSLPMTKEERDCFKLWTQGLSPITVSAYELDLKLFKQFVKKPMEEVEPRDIQLYQTQMNTAPNSRQRRMASLKSFFKCFAALGYIGKSPVRWSRSIKIRPNYAERYLEQEVVAQMINQEPNPRNQLILQTLYTCGLRVSELCNSCWGNLSVNRKTNIASLYVYGKGGKERVITLTSELSQALLTYRGKQSNNTLDYEKIVLGVENLSTWCHELIHVTDKRLGRLIEKKNHREVVAKLGGAVLLQLLGRYHDADLGGAYDYIQTYAMHEKMDPVQACILTLNRTCDWQRPDTQYS